MALRGWGGAQAEVVEGQGHAQLGQGVGILRGKNASFVIDVELQRGSAGQAGGGQAIKIGEQEFALVKFGAGEPAAAIVERVEHGKKIFAVRQPAVGRGVEWPEFTGPGALPAADGSENAFGRDGMGGIIFDGPTADLGAVEFEGVKAQRFGGGEAAGTRRFAVETFFEEVENGLRPGFGVSAAGSAGSPEMGLIFGASQETGGGKSVAPAAGESELIGGSGGALPP